MSMTHGNNGRSTEDSTPPDRPPSVASSSSGSGSSKHVKCIGRYVLTGHTLGKGNFARVEAAVHTLTRAKVAIKIIETDKIKEDYVRKNLLREAQLMRRLRHPNIIRLYETMKTNNLYCLVTEVAEGGELLSHVRNDFKEKRLSEASARPFIRQLVSALYHLHSVGVVHRDLKMENILLDKKKRSIKIVDFGLSNAQKPGSLLQTHCGSPEYAAPELFIPGREYGPEVDVWSLGVNMYAMLVGKLPFRSPRQGTKRRQKLLEQITNGLSEAHEKELAHISPGAHDLIGKLLQPEPRKRVRLEEVMVHSWITKDGSQSLVPYSVTHPDAATQQNAIELMSAVLEVGPSEVKETVRRDRCDWVAAIYNLLIDQPEGRNILQGMLNKDPDDQLMDAAHYPVSTEHLRLSQGELALDQTPSADVAIALTHSTAQGSRRPVAFRHTLPSDPTDYDSATLPITKREKRHRHQEMRPLGAPRQPLNPVQPPPGYNRRASIASPYTSPEHQMPYQGSTLGHTRAPRRVLPMTPKEEPYLVPREPVRPHSRADSAPEPLPVPWRPKLVHQKHRSPTHEDVRSLHKSPATSAEQSPESSPPHLRHRLGQLFEQPSQRKIKEPMVSPLAQLVSKATKGSSSRKKVLDPIRPRTVSLGTSRKLSGSIDAQLHLQTGHPQTSSFTSGWRGHGQVGPTSRRLSMDSVPPSIGWAGPFSQRSAGSSYNKLSHADDIHGMMQKKLPVSAYRSLENIEDLPQEAFALRDTPSPQQWGNDPSPQSSKVPMVRSVEQIPLRVDPISGQEVPPQMQRTPPQGYVSGRQRRYKSASAKPRPHSMHGSLRPEISASTEHFGQLQAIANGPTRFSNQDDNGREGYSYGIPGESSKERYSATRAPGRRLLGRVFNGGKHREHNHSSHPHT